MLRNVEPDDIEIFYTQEADPVANAMAAFPARDRITERPLHACVVEHNRASIRVLVKCGFDVVGTHEPIREILLRLDAP